jgi:aminotransferase
MTASRLTLSRRSEGIVKADIRTMTVECERVGGVNLAQGVCDMEVPIEVRRAAQEAIEAGVNSYTRHDGLARLREAIAGKMERFNGIKADPETEIVVSGGATGALYSACLAVLDPGDEVVLFEPFYGYHVNTLLAVDAVPRYVRLRPPGWTFDPADVEKAVGPRTRAMLLCTPANPSGKVFSRAELESLAEVAARHDLFVLSDEIYEYFLYDGRQHVSPGAIDAIADRTVTVSGYSKTFSITGWRVGYSVADRRWSETIGYASDLVYVCAPSPLQVGVAEGILRLDEAYYAGLKAAFTRKRDTISRALRRAGFEFADPAGAYYILADASHLPGASGRDRAVRLLETTGVAAVPGGAFYADGGGDELLRFCYAKEDDVLDDACSRLVRGA